jgi:cell division initiation protein
MKITPLDIRQKRFETGMRGFDRTEVELFLELVAVEFEEVVKENISVKQELQRASMRIDEYQERERALQETMVTAQRISEDVRAQAKKEAEIIVAEAEHQAEKIVHTAHQKLVQVVEDINELKRQRIQFESQVRGVIDGHLKLLEHFRRGTEWERTDEESAFLSHKANGSNS